MSECRCHRCRPKPGCFWCGARASLTRDHVVPKVAGGKDAHNVVMACAGCQRGRGFCQGLVGQIRAFASLLKTTWDDGFDARARLVAWRKSLTKQAKLARRKQLNWFRIEKGRWLSSPTAALDLRIPELPET